MVELSERLAETAHSVPEGRAAQLRQSQAFRVPLRRWFWGGQRGIP